jgi:predicted lactoylglutathione lyase
MISKAVPIPTQSGICLATVGCPTFRFRRPAWRNQVRSTQASSGGKSVAEATITSAYVHGIDAAIDRIKANGGDVVKPPYDEGGLWVATFSDPAGNVLGIWQNGPR